MGAAYISSNWNSFTQTVLGKRESVVLRGCMSEDGVSESMGDGVPLTLDSSVSEDGGGCGLH